MRRDFEIVETAIGQALEFAFPRSGSRVFIRLPSDRIEEHVLNTTTLACPIGRFACEAGLVMEYSGDVCKKAILECTKVNCPAFDPPPPDIHDRAPIPDPPPQGSGAVVLEPVLI